MAPETDFNHVLISRGAKQVMDAGGSVQLGAHGQLQGMGAHWELWMLQQGGMTPMEALRAATIAGARYLGLDGDIGSLEKGKLADLIVLERNPLENVRNTEAIAMVMFAVLGPMLLVLAAIGIYAVVSYTVSQRTTEIGVRLALGSTPQAVVRQFVKESLSVIAVGAFAGWSISLSGVILLGADLDVPIFVGVPLLLMAVAAAACWLSARRAAHAACRSRADDDEAR